MYGCVSVCVWGGGDWGGVTGGDGGGTGGGGVLSACRRGQKE